MTPGAAKTRNRLDEFRPAFELTGGHDGPDPDGLFFPGGSRALAGAVALTRPAALHAWLRSATNYPFFSKPCASGFARAAMLAHRYEPEGDCLAIHDGTRLRIDDCCAHFQDLAHLGYLFQSPIQPHAQLLPSLGPIVTSLRMMILYDEQQGPILHRAFWKLPTGRNSHDNYNGGRTGNLAAAIDMHSGRIVRVINGCALELVDVTHHPDTRVRLDTVSVPDWPEVHAFALDVALALPRLRFQQWDIALSDHGPVVLEVNQFGTGGADLTQLLYRKGLLDETMSAFLARHESPGRRRH